MIIYILSDGSIYMKLILILSLSWARITTISQLAWWLKWQSNAPALHRHCTGIAPALQRSAFHSQSERNFSGLSCYFLSSAQLSARIIHWKFVSLHSSNTRISCIFSISIRVTVCLSKDYRFEGTLSTFIVHISCQKWR